jgi:hypothetical protein
MSDLVFPVSLELPTMEEYLARNVTLLGLEEYNSGYRVAIGGLRGGVEYFSTHSGNDNVEFRLYVDKPLVAVPEWVKYLAASFFVGIFQWPSPQPSPQMGARETKVVGLSAVW